MDTCQFEHGGGDIHTGYLETRIDQEPRYWSSCPTPDVKHIATRRQERGKPNQQLIAFKLVTLLVIGASDVVVPVLNNALWIIAVHNLFYCT